MTTLTSNDTEELKDLTPDEQPVEDRLPKAEDAQAMGNTFLQLDIVRAQRRNKVQGKFNGNSPKSTAAMQLAGRLGDSNLNWKEHRGIIMNAWTPYFDLVCEVPVCIDGELKLEGADGSTISQELKTGFFQAFHRMLFGWRNFDDTTQLRDLEMLLHGNGILAWEDEWDWRPKAILAGDFFVPDETEISLENCDIAMVKTTMTVSELWKKIREPERAKAMGWNVDVCREVIMKAGKSQNISLAYQWDKWEQALKNGDLYISSKQVKQIEVWIFYVMQMDGSMSQKIVPAMNQDAATEFMYERHYEKYESWDDCICVFPYDIGADGTFHSVKGLGTDIFPYCELLDKIQNTIADVLVTGIKPMWQPSTGDALEKWQMVKFGGGNLIPPGLTNIQMDIASSISPAVESAREFRNVLAQNTGSYGSGDVAPPTVEETAKAAMIRAMDRSKLTKGAHNRYYRGLDREYSQIWKRATNPKLKKWHPGAREALAFQKECYDLCDKYNVPHEILQQVKSIRAVRSVGLGSASMRIEIANALMEKWQYLPGEAERRNALRAWLSALMSYASVDSYAPSLTEGERMTDDDSQAADEDNSMTILGVLAEVVITDRQNNVIHLNHHVPSAENDIQLLQQGQIQLQDAYNRLEAKSIHSHEHLLRIEGNPLYKPQFDDFTTRLAAIASVQDHIQQNLAEQQANQPPQPGQVDPELVKVQGNLDLKADKQHGEMMLKADKQAKQQQLDEQRAAAQITLQRQQALGKIVIDAGKATAEAELKRATAAQTEAAA